MTPAEILAQYEKLSLHEANEAETRLKVIDQVLFSVLGWTHDDVHVEERVSEDGATTFADYTLRTGMTAVVIEAKKVGVSFDEVPDVRRAPLRGKLVSGDTGKAITQARDYARKLGIPFAVATNGNSWIVFPATRTDQVQFSDSSAIIFPTLRSVLHDDYTEFFSLLSRQAVIGGSLENELLGRIANQLEERRLNRFYPSSFSKINRHSLFPLIEAAVSVAFSEDIVTTDPELLKKCYVQTPERTRFDARIRMHISRRESVTPKSARRALKAKQENPLGELVESASAQARPLAILILGPVGAGKTTFLEFTRQVEASALFEPTSAQPYPHWIQIDFRDSSASEAPLKFIYSRLKERIESDPFLSDYERCIRHAYKKEIDALLRGPMFLLASDETEKKRRITELLIRDYEETQPYVEKILRYAASHAPVFLVVDNVDQIESQEHQSAIFSDAVAISHRLKLSLICSIREATFVRNRKTPTFDAFDYDAITIDAPQVQAVLSRRFTLARELLDKKPGKFVAENGAHVSVANLADVIDLVQMSVLGTNIGNLIDVFATSDIRLALRMTREFLRSGWTATGKALQIFQSTGKYVMPEHEALRAIMIGNQQIYAEEHSVMGNPFDAKLARTEAQLLRLYVLTALVQFSSRASFRYLSGTDIRTALREIGFGDKVALEVLRDLCDLRFAHTVSHTEATLEANYIPSRLGGYIVRDLIGNFMFLENVLVDTFIPDNELWNRLRQRTDEIYATRNPIERLQIRKDRLRVFFDYMENWYQKLRDESIRRGLPSEWCSHPLQAIRNRFDENLSKATRSAQRNYGSSSSP